MRFACLGSGSQGNSLVVEANRTRVMLDCGFPLRETTARLARLGLSPEMLDAILVTHEHDDHAAGVARFAARHDLPVWMTYGTLRALGTSLPPGVEVVLLDCHHKFSIGELEIEPFPVPHDAREPAQYVFGDGARRLGVLTDTGCATPHIAAVLSGCHALVLECNHDRGMLAHGPYPPSLQKRIASRLGHLDNDSAAGLLAGLDASRLQHVIAAHLSQKNNTPQLARVALAGALSCSPEWIVVADQKAGFAWRDVR